METTLRPGHPLWGEFTDRLNGPEGCNFHKNAAGKIVWKCKGNFDLALAIIDDLNARDSNGGIDTESTLAYFRSHGGYCDCEILFNVEDAAERDR